MCGRPLFANLVTYVNLSGYLMFLFGLACCLVSALLRSDCFFSWPQLFCMSTPGLSSNIHFIRHRSCLLGYNAWTPFFISSVISSPYRCFCHELLAFSISIMILFLNFLFFFHPVPPLWLTNLFDFLGFFSLTALLVLRLWWHVVFFCTSIKILPIFS